MLSAVEIVLNNKGILKSLEECRDDIEANKYLCSMGINVNLVELNDIREGYIRKGKNDNNTLTMDELDMVAAGMKQAAKSKTIVHHNSKKTKNIRQPIHSFEHVVTETKDMRDSQRNVPADTKNTLETQRESHEEEAIDSNTVEKITEFIDIFESYTKQPETKEDRIKDKKTTDIPIETAPTAVSIDKSDNVDEQQETSEASIEENSSPLNLDSRSIEKDIPVQQFSKTKAFEHEDIDSKNSPDYFEDLATQHEKDVHPTVAIPNDITEKSCETHHIFNDPAHGEIKISTHDFPEQKIPTLVNLIKSIPFRDKGFLQKDTNDICKAYNHGTNTDKTHIMESLDRFSLLYKNPHTQGDAQTISERLFEYCQNLNRGRLLGGGKEVISSSIGSSSSDDESTSIPPDNFCKKLNKIMKNSYKKGISKSGIEIVKLLDKFFSSKFPPSLPCVISHLTNLLAPDLLMAACQYALEASSKSTLHTKTALQSAHFNRIQIYSDEEIEKIEASLIELKSKMISDLYIPSANPYIAYAKFYEISYIAFSSKNTNIIEQIHAHSIYYIRSILDLYLSHFICNSELFNIIPSYIRIITSCFEFLNPELIVMTIEFFEELRANYMFDSSRPTIDANIERLNRLLAQ